MSRTTKTLTLLVLSVLLGPRAFASVDYIFTSTDPRTYGFIRLDIPSEAAGTEWTVLDIESYYISIGGKVAAPRNPRSIRFGLTNPTGGTSGSFGDPGYTYQLVPNQVTVESPFTAFTAQPGVNDVLSGKAIDTELWQLFRDLAVHCELTPCASTFRTEVPITWFIPVPEPALGSATAIAVLLLASLSCGRRVPKPILFFGQVDRTHGGTR